MCVENCSRRVKGPITAWKIFLSKFGRLSGLKNFHYKIDKSYTTKPPGFQAFVYQADAEEAIRRSWPGDYIMRKVYLYDAAQGIITRMDSFSNGKSGWTAKKIMVPRKNR
jgi:hypothetical protein